MQTVMCQVQDRAAALIPVAKITQEVVESYSGALTENPADAFM